MNIRFAAAVVIAIACAVSWPAHSQGVLGVMVVDSQVNPQGAFVNTVQPGSAAASAGLVPGDVITGVDGNPVAGASELHQIMASHHPGDRLILQVVRYGGGSAEISVTLGGAGAASTAQAAPQPSAGAAAPAAAGSGPAKPDMIWTRFTDPVEHAFTIDVPKGWRSPAGPGG